MGGLVRFLYFIIWSSEVSSELRGFLGIGYSILDSSEVSSDMGGLVLTMHHIGETNCSDSNDERNYVPYSYDRTKHPSVNSSEVFLYYRLLFTVSVADVPCWQSI
jgi:hypothetical protein